MRQNSAQKGPIADAEKPKFKLALKRALDLAVAIGGLAFLWPVMAIIALLIKLDSPGPVFFVQTRIGKGGRPFRMLKFRTMTAARDAKGELLPDSERLTPLGQFLRSASLDELPELIHVLRGEMSLVGPRPLLVEYLARYTPEQMRRHEVLPGITGLAQCNGRNTLTWEKRFALDVRYVDQWSLWLDIRILGVTLKRVLRRQGISHPGHATMEEFMGVESEL